jgi:FMN phosphatase YigB (HAD superfamily)
MTDKNKTLTLLKSIAFDKNEDILFIDDNIQNVIDALDHGIQSFWANWGYNIPEHKLMALKKGINELDTEALLKLVKKSS